MSDVFRSPPRPVPRSVVGVGRDGRTEDFVQGEEEEEEEEDEEEEGGGGSGRCARKKAGK